VATLSVVVLEPWRKGCCSGVVIEKGLAVGPLGEQGSVQALYPAVLPRAVGSDEDLLDAGRGAEIAQGVAVGPGVVSNQSLDGGDALSCEVGDHPVTVQDRRGDAQREVNRRRTQTHVTN
jgi:hypothetical protein